MKTPELPLSRLLKSIGEYRKKYYQNQLFKGSLIAIALLLSIFLAINTIEYFGQFNSLIRGALLFGYIGAFSYVSYRWIITPVMLLSGLSKPISDEEAARQIGLLFPAIGDKLLNTLQLGRQHTAQSDLIEASIQQKSGQLLMVRFSEAVNFAENSRYLKYAAYPVAVLAIILLFKPSFLTTSSERILKFNNTFDYAPFRFVLENRSLKSFRGEDYTVGLTLEGEAVPQQVFLISGGTRFKMTPDVAGTFSYTFKSLQKDIPFHFEAAGYPSRDYQIQLIEKPGLLSFDVQLDYPAYLGKPSESLQNVGNLTVPEGTRVTWKFKTAATDQLNLRFGEDSASVKGIMTRRHQYEARKTLRKSGDYEVFLKNSDSPDGKPVGYYANVIPDLAPEMSLESVQDTLLFNYLALGGAIRDDYGFSQLKLFYNIYRAGTSKPENSTPKYIPIPFNRQVNNQNYYFQWYVDSLRLGPGDRLEYYTQVWDNDGVNGPKSTRSGSLSFALPDKNEILTQISKSSDDTREEIEKSISQAKQLEQNLKELEHKLKSNQELDFQEKKMAEEILKKREELIRQVQSIQEKNKRANDKSRQFSQQSEEFQKKMDELQKLMDELMKDDSQKLYEEFEKMLEQKQSERMSKLLERLRNKEKGTEKELERTLNLFKQLQLEQKIESSAKELEELAEKQEELAEKTENPAEKDPRQKGAEDDKDSTADQQPTEKNERQAGLQQEQDNIGKEFKEIRDRLADLERLGEEIGKKTDTRKAEQENAREAQEKSKQQLGKQQNREAGQSQKKSAKSMRNIAQALMDQNQKSQQMQMMENMDALRDILENVHALSVDQEQLMKDFRGVHLSDPRFVGLAQKQLKLQDDSKIVEDSLYALANRLREVKSFVTREVGNMKYYMDESVKYIRDRRLPNIASNQQFAMTSVNNLALMLSDLYAQLQKALADAMKMPGTGEGEEGGPSPGEMQQMLNEKMKQLGKGKNGERGMSEELARMAAEQAAIREMLGKMLDEQKGAGFGDQYGKELKEILEQMEKSETQIVNKKVDPELIRRNEEMVTRLLESEKALREQDEDNERKGETAREIQRQPPPALEEYIRNKSQQTELLRTVPPNFTPFYKKEADQYFQGAISR
ncbi:ATPase [Ravibacter arvi]|uniref:ATPase n=1 Tax=Ravibacter arvi TaxID=2051041 RepID=A0ABP8MA44_9BACT